MPEFFQLRDHGVIAVIQGVVCVVSTLIAVWACGGLDNLVAQASFTYQSGAGLGPKPIDSDADSYAEVPGFD